jgi:hypothetical protein
VGQGPQVHTQGQAMRELGHATPFRAGKADQPNQLVGSQDSRPLMLVRADFTTFLEIIGRILSVVQPNAVGGFTEVVA